MISINVERNGNNQKKIEASDKNFAGVDENAEIDSARIKSGCGGERNIQREKSSFGRPSIFHPHDQTCKQTLKRIFVLHFNLYSNFLEKEQIICQII